MFDFLWRRTLELEAMTKPTDAEIKKAEIAFRECWIEPPYRGEFTIEPIAKLLADQRTLYEADRHDIMLSNCALCDKIKDLESKLKTSTRED